MLEMQLRCASCRPTCGAHVKYMPKLSGELSPAFAEQNDHHARLEALADFVGNRHATLFDQGDRPERPAFGLTVLGDLQGHRCGVALNGQGGEAVGDHQRRRSRLRMLVERGGAGFVEAPTEVGTLQVDLSV